MTKDEARTFLLEVTKDALEQVYKGGQMPSQIMKYFEESDEHLLEFFQRDLEEGFPEALKQALKDFSK